jgi:vanillate O-demethylase monooxygenase subunit
MRVEVDGESIALFRDGAGIVGALADCCPHRRMRLSLGKVEQGRLSCCYHGWRFDANGAGESPGTPKLYARAKAFETKEAYGAVWLRTAGSATDFPRFEVDGYWFVGRMFHTVEVPLEIVVDNFTEVEHTPTTHALLGYEMSRMTEVETRVEPAESSVRVFNAGPQKKLSKPLEILFGIRSGDRFVDDWTTRFSPVHACYDQYWSDPQSLVEHGLRWRIYVFFVPLGSGKTMLATFPFLKEQPGFVGSVSKWRVLRPVLMKLVDREIRLDVTMMENLADKSPGIEGMKLSRFDKVLGLHRERINKLYRGGVAINGAPAGAR